MLLLCMWSLERLWRWQSKSGIMKGGFDDRRWLKCFRNICYGRLFLSKVLNLQILLPEHNLLTEWLVWLVSLWTMEFFPTNSIVTCALRSQSNFKILYSKSSQVLRHRWSSNWGQKLWWGWSWLELSFTLGEEEWLWNDDGVLGGRGQEMRREKPTPVPCYSPPILHRMP